MRVGARATFRLKHPPITPRIALEPQCSNTQKTQMWMTTKLMVTKPWQESVHTDLKCTADLLQRTWLGYVLSYPQVRCLVFQERPSYRAAQRADCTSDCLTPFTYFVKCWELSALMKAQIWDAIPFVRRHSVKWGCNFKYYFYSDNLNPMKHGLVGDSYVHGVMNGDAVGGAAV